MMAKLQRFGGAMFVPVLLFSFAGIILSFSILFQNELIMGSVAAEGSLWRNVWSVLEAGGWTVFNQIELLFVIGLPIGLASKAAGRASLESFIVYMTFQSFLAKILEIWGSNFGVDYAAEPGGVSGLKLIGSVKTLDTNIIGAILVAAIVVWLHNRYFDTKLPDWLGVFQGSTFVYILGFFIVLPLAFITAWGWPVIQGGIATLQGWLASSGAFGVFVYVFLERILIPTGLHHFVYQPFIYGPAVIEGGVERAWLDQLNVIASNPAPLREQFPEGAFALHNMSKIFAPIGISGAFYATAKKEKRQEVLSLLLPTAFTAIMAGITEPFEFTFLFIAPQLFFIHSLLAASLATTMYLFGLAGDIGSGLISVVSKFIIPMWSNHLGAIVTWLVIGLIFSAIYFVVFSLIINKFDLKTPGREDDEAEVKMYSKQDYKDKKKQASAGFDPNDTSHDPSESKVSDKAMSSYAEEAANDPSRGRFAVTASNYVDLLGGPENITDVNNCASRLRLTVKDPNVLATDKAFKENGAHGVVRKGQAIQVIIGLDVPQVRDEVDIEIAKRTGKA
ncbi:alpha-glucoside-specific PTS transporter subunit IIBC [Aerococcus urinaeequi]|uniref:alpha-glucoside-specific PTS transporter subunit IIBC n=1 Tax=Aerococcus sp. HMSC10H05 TaxID=1581084 RepID=UPI0008A295C5|nr:alpha-glucoside-specific PTS transporter subunit IIBC [Aerococcus sp. HMSC10H05]OFU53037.1 PTS alpha-glucoside transporter subunit IIBC [Aerococcus sp. HMSC10H05]